MLKVFALAALSMPLLGTAAAAPGESGPARVLTFVDCRSAAVEHCKTLLARYAQALRQHSGRFDVEVAEEIGRPHRFIVLESADDPAKLTSMEASEQRLLDPLNEWLVAPLDRRTHVDFGDVPALSQAPPVKTDPPMSVYVIAHLDLGPPDQARGQAALTQMVAAARRSPGNLHFDAWQQSSRPNHFNMIAAWRSEAALNDFSASAAAREFRATVAPLIGSPFDERLYRRLN